MLYVYPLNLTQKTCNIAYYICMYIILIRNDNDAKNIENSNQQTLLLPRPCDFGVLYSELVLSGGISILVDDVSHENVFELQPITKFVGSRPVSRMLDSKQGSTRSRLITLETPGDRDTFEYNYEDYIYESQNEQDKTPSDPDIDPKYNDVSALLKTNLIDYKPNKTVADSIKVLNKLLYNRPDF